MQPTDRRAVFKPKIFESLRNYSGAAFQADIGAGITVGIVALPLCLALGIASGVRPVQGIYTAVIAGVIVGLMGGSRVQIAGPTAAFVPIVYGIVVAHGVQNLYLCTMMAGVLLVIMGLSRMGSLIKFIPYPVTSGFTTGIAVMIIFGQVEDSLGLTTTGDRPAHFVPKVQFLAEFISTLNPWAVGITIACIAIIWFWPRLGLKRIPGPIVAVIVSAIATKLLNLPVETIATRFAEGVPQGLPGFALPAITWEAVSEMMIPATAIAMLAAIESLLSAVVADGLTNDRHRSNTELIAQGAANIVSPLFMGIPVTGAIARTASNIDSGARSPVSSIVHSVTLALVLLVLAPYAGSIPMAAMAAVLIMVARRMGEWRELVHVSRLPGSDALVLVATFSLTIVFDLTVAVLIGMLLAGFLFTKRLSETTEISKVTAADELENLEQLVHGKQVPEGAVVFRIFGPFFFGAAEKMEDALEGAGKLPRVLILRMNLVPAMDATALNALETVLERLVAAGGTLVISGAHRQPLAMMMRAGFVEKLGRANIRANFDEALVRAREILGVTPTR
ncbi:MAG TPA: SulP family inorganic anion transporter [Opitutaceae bacterium]|nr:SulP family inorganic anion transporter [Opitutaceae bacterium]